MRYLSTALASLDGRLHGGWFTTADQSLGWYDVARFQRLGEVPWRGRDRPPAPASVAGGTAAAVSTGFECAVGVAPGLAVDAAVAQAASAREDAG